MFVLTTVVDKIRVPADMLNMPTLEAIHNEIDIKYPNRVLMNVGLVICRAGSILKTANGLCVMGDGGSYHESLFKLVVFRPFVEEVCLGTIVKSTPEGIQVSLGNFYHDIFIPAYWMLSPSRYSEKLGLWVWSPDYGDGDGSDDGSKSAGGDDAENDTGGADGADTTVKVESDAGVKKEGESATASIENETKDVTMDEGGNETKDVTMDEGENEPKAEDVDKDETMDEDDTSQNGGEHFEMEIGAEIRFKVKSIHFTQVTHTAKGVQATTTTSAHSHDVPTSSKASQGEDGKELSPEAKQRSLRKRSLSVEISDMSNLPASMNIVASICEDGLGLTSWWASGDGDDDDDGDNDDDNDNEEE